jgi:hypothetical protein
VGIEVIAISTFVGWLVFKDDAYKTQHIFLVYHNYLVFLKQWCSINKFKFLDLVYDCPLPRNKTDSKLVLSEK